MSDVCERAEQLLDGISPGPWYWEPETEVQAWVLTDTPTEVSGPRTCVAQRVDYPDAEFIAAAPALVADLLAECRRLAAERDAARAATSRVRVLADRWESSRPDEDTTVDEAHVWNAAGIHIRHALQEDTDE